MREDIKTLIDLREAEEKTFKVIADNFHRNMDAFDTEIDRIRNNCKHIYGPEEINSFFGFGVSVCTLCGQSRVTG